MTAARKPVVRAARQVLLARNRPPVTAICGQAPAVIIAHEDW
jgi:hypothetical protein